MFLIFNVYLLFSLVIDHLLLLEEEMGYDGTSIGKYQLGRTIGEGMFAKVKLGVNFESGQCVAIKVIDKKMILKNKLMYQVEREISTMKLLNHPNIVKIYEVIATKTRIYIVMEYVSGGQLADKMCYLKNFEESEARRYFQQLIDAVDYCHARGVYHRDLKPENLLLDDKGNLKVSDFGLSVLKKPGDLLSTACGSPSYVAPEVIIHKHYEGMAADIWSCGIILFELLSGHLPFEDKSLTNLYRKISRADYACPDWFTPLQKNLILKILDPLPTRRATIAEILEDDWFLLDYQPSTGIADEEDASMIDDCQSIDSDNSNPKEREESETFINAFQLIAMSSDLDLSSLFHEKDNDKQKTKLGSENSVNETIEKIEVAAKDVGLFVERMNNSKVKLHGKIRLPISRSLVILSAEVVEVTPAHCVVEVSKHAGEIRLYKEFCRSLSNVLEEKQMDNGKDCRRLDSSMKLATSI